MNKLLILGGGDFAMEIADLVSDLPGWQVTGFAVNQPSYQAGSTLLDKPIYWIDDLKPFAESHYCIGGIGTTRRWTFTDQVERMGFRFATIIHPTARVSRQATVGKGSVISAGAVISTHTQIGQHVIINRGALIGHHVTIHDHVTVSPGVTIGGNAIIGRRSWVGMGAIILEQRRVGEQSIVGAGALVTRDVPDRTQVIGMPARVVEENVAGH